MPTLINKYRSYTLHKQFLKSYSNLSQAILLMKSENGIENLRQQYVIYVNADEFYEEFDKYMKVVKVVPQYSISNYTATADASNVRYDTPTPLYILTDASSYGRRISSGRIRFWIDSNGPKKGPNRYGFDIFEFRISDNTDMVRAVKQSRVYAEDELEELGSYADFQGSPCNKYSKQRQNGMGCSWYALNNINPDDETKKYWDSLPW